ncbi:blast:FH1/FH2 domain-containing protein 3 [Drosophila guanche]|uniref:Blast:FH1/FH2 domain-containing protein 3 n=1 Tax=Drosophila guanche TaxID=7266 RepID=A0A3B0K1V4_DROGU|nr:blast:FH1/FH2 domain-containing protein 3 [Drosophila guanche]
MSSYRSYTPWKSSLGSSYKTGSSSYGVGTDSTSRYSSLATPSAYRPSFSGGTYRLKRDPPTNAPPPVTSYVSRYAKTEPKETTASERSSPIKRYTGVGATSSTLGKYGRSRDPSPVALEHTNRGKSRDPSPVIDSGRSKLGGSYRSGNASTSSSSSAARNGYGSRFGAAPSRISNGSSNGSAISYLTTSDFHARTASRARASREKEHEVPSSPPEKPTEEAAKSKQASPEKEQEQEKVAPDPQPEEIFVSVSVVTRATSPTPPGSTTVQRTRRIDIAKTIEKTIQRSTKPRQMLEKEIQSDRLDDSTRYLRYSGGSSSLSPTYSPHRDRISSLRYSASPLSSKSASPSVEGKSSASSAEVPSPATKSNGTLSNGSSAKSSASASKSKLSPPKAIRLNTSRQSSVENLANKPPAVPTKSESPTKTCSSSSSGSSAVKWPNKDFRKSSLNVGPTDRPRKSRTPSGGESEDVLTNGGSGSGQLERSPSAGSEVSVASASSGKKSSKLSNGKVSSSAGSRQGTSSSSAATSSTSASDSEQRGVKTVKKQSKKKTPKEGKVVAGNAGQLLANQNSRKSNTPAANATPESPSPERNNADRDPSESPVAPAAPPNRSPQTRRLQKLSSVSNFFANRQQDANSEPIFLESSESSGEPEAPPSISLVTDLNTNEPRTKSSKSTKTTPTSEANTSTRSPLSPPSSSTRCPATTRITTTATTSATISSSSTNTTATQDTSLSTTSEQDPSQEEPSWWQDTSLQINTASALDQNNQNGEMPPYRLRHIDSGEEQAWWLRRSEADDEGDDDTLAEETLNPLDDDPSHWSSQDHELETHSKVKQMPRSRISPDQDAWWLEEEQEEPPSQTQAKLESQSPQTRSLPQSPPLTRSLPQSPPQLKSLPQSPLHSNGYHEDENNNNNETHVEVTLKLPSGSKSNSKSHSDDGPKPWWMSGPTKKLFNVQRVESGERAWWQDNNEKEKEKEKEMEPPPVKPPTPPPRIIKHWESGERAWWLQDEPEAAQSAAVAVAVAANASSDEEEEEEEQQQRLGRDETDLRQQQQHQLEVPHELSSSFHFAYTERPPPLGQCASPVPTEQRLRCPSPYDNIPMGRAPMPAAQPATPSSLQPRFSPQMRRPGEKLFISRHQNIDELLGGACRPLSPLFYNNSSSDAAQESGTNMFLLDESSSLASKNMFLLEEITPDQVRIHDSTAQRPVIQRMQRDVEWLENGSSFYEPPKQHHQQLQQQQQRIDDAAIQVYKDGDYGAYLDLESSLAEQTEEIEGLNASRKNSLVVRTQLNVRVHSIIEKLLSSEGSDLRRALFSLKQVFQEDKDLVHAFVALGGLNCLVRVGNCADQNYQNYILRALGQVMLYVDGMNGVMKHEPTMQWLYSLIASNYRSVVKTALKLLLVFVEYAESNCYVLVSAIHAVDATQGTLPWSNIMRLLKDYDNADAELVIYATSLINKTLAGLNDQDTFYDESDLLEQQGMETVIQRYMSKPGTDLDLLDQLQLYEAVLKFEDGESDGQRLPQNSMRKTQRYRPGTNTTERRKSRRHSTDNSPVPITKVLPTTLLRMTPTQGTLDEDSSGSTNSTEFSGGLFNEKKPRDGAGVTPGLRRRRERAERHKSFLKEQQEAAANGIFAALEQREGLELDSEGKQQLQLQLQLKRDHTVKDLTQKLSNLPTSPTQEPGSRSAIVGDMSGLISKAKEGLAKSKSKGEISRSSSVDQELKKSEPKKSENELHWEELVRNMTRPLNLCDLDFTDLHDDDEKDVLAPRGLGAGIPPPPPPFGSGGILPPPMMPPAPSLIPPPMFGYGGSLTNSVNSSLNGSVNGELVNGNNTIKKNKKTVKLFWKEVREDLIPQVVGKTIWDELPNANVDTQKLEHLFESRAKDLMTKKQQELNKSKEIIVLDHKRSNAINIAITKLPPPRAIKAAILKMDATVVTREGIDKLLNMLPTDEERGKIQEAQLVNPELPLGSAEQFLLTLASISELGARLKLWAFRLDFDNSEKEIAEPLMDLKQGIEILRQNRTFRSILSTLLSVGIFLNGAPVKGFQIEYLAKVPEVKDTVHKHSLLHHLCHMVMESSSDTSDLYSEIGPITRASKADFTDLAHNLTQLESECKASWDRLKVIAKHDCPPPLKQKLVDFLADCAERIIILQIVHRRVMNRYRKFLLWLGMPQHSVAESRPNEFCRTLSEFALEYRTTRERVQQQLEKKANHRERNKTRGKLIIDMAKFKTKEDVADAELKTLLGTPSADQADGTLTWRRRRAEQLRSPIARQSEEQFTDGDDEILESLVKTATKAPGTRTTPRERKRTRNADRKSLKRSRTREGFTVERAPSP